jgi:spermidine/putrescine transport system permease protein
LKTLKKVYLSLVLIFMYAPIAVLIIFSFNESRSRANWTGFTLNWYVELFRDQRILNALSTTFTIALFSTLIAIVLGTAAAIGINAMKPAGKRAVMSVNNIPVVNPDIVMGVSLMILYVFVFRFFVSGLELGYATLLMAHLSFNTSYVVLSVLPKLRQIDKNVYEAALDLGATPFQGFVKVVVPEIMPGIMTGALLAFTMSIDDFVVSFFTSGSGVENLSMVIYSMTKRGINPKINAISTLMLIFVMTLLYLVNRMDKKNKKKEASS